MLVLGGEHGAVSGRLRVLFGAQPAQRQSVIADERDAGDDDAAAQADADHSYLAVTDRQHWRAAVTGLMARCIVNSRVELRVCTASTTLHCTARHCHTIPSETLS